MPTKKTYDLCDNANGLTPMIVVEDCIARLDLLASVVTLVLKQPADFPDEPDFALNLMIFDVVDELKSIMPHKALPIQ